MEDAGWTLPLFLCCGYYDARGQGRRSACGLISRLPLLRPKALTRRTRQGPSGPTGPSPAPEGWLHPAVAGRRLGVRRGSSGLLQA